MFRILVGGSWGGQRVTGGCKHSPCRLVGCTFVLGQLKVDVSCGVFLGLSSLAQSTVIPSSTMLFQLQKADIAPIHPGYPDI